MGWTDKNELDKIQGVGNICDRILKEMDEQYPWVSVVRYLVEKIKKEYGDM